MQPAQNASARLAVVVLHKAQWAQGRILAIGENFIELRLPPGLHEESAVVAVYGRFKEEHVRDGGRGDFQTGNLAVCVIDSGEDVPASLRRSIQLRNNRR